MYDIILRQTGKGRTSKHYINVQRAQSLERFCPNKLLIGLFGAIGGYSTYCHPKWLKDMVDTGLYLDRLSIVGHEDEEWQGPRASLGQVAQYLQTIVRSVAEFNSNPFCFPRLLIHIMSLRHYSFSGVVMRLARSKSNNQSTVSNLFRSLREQQSKERSLLGWRQASLQTAALIQKLGLDFLIDHY